MREMKDSGIEWIGEIPTDWEMIPIKYLASYNDETLSENTTPDFEFDYIEIGSVEYGKGITAKEHLKFSQAPSRARRIVRANDIIVSTVRTYLRAVAPITSHEDGQIASTGFIVIRPKNIVSSFLRYAILSENFICTVEANSTGISYPAINASQVVQIKIPVPSTAEQQCIANCLDCKCAEIDAVIERTKATIEEYKKLKQSIITEAVTKGIRSNRPMKDSGVAWIGSIPADWSVSKIKIGVTKVGSGKTPLGGAESYAEEGVLFLRSQNVYDTGLLLDSPTYITELVDEEMKSTRVYPRDVLLNITGGSIGRCCIFPEEYIRANVNQHVSIIRVIASVFLPEYMHYYWLSSLGHTAIDLYQTGGNREGMSADAIKNSPIPVIPIEEQQEIVAYLDKKCAEMDTLIARKTALWAELESYKKSVIYEYVTGKKEVG